MDSGVYLGGQVRGKITALKGHKILSFPPMALVHNSFKDTHSLDPFIRNNKILTMNMVVQNNPMYTHNLYHKYYSTQKHVPQRETQFN